MPTDKEAFEKWLDDHCVDRQTEQNWHHDEQLKDHYETGLWLKHQAECFEEQPVPKWDAEATFQVKKEKKDWFGWLNMSPSLSMAMSLAAILMVLFRVELHFGDNGVLLTFAGDSRADMQQLVDEKLTQFSRDQQIVLANYVDDIQAQQQQDVTQLASYLINASRQERKEEISELVTYLKVQRNEDMSLNDQKLSNIVYRINQANGKDMIQRVSYEPVADKDSNKLSNEEGK
jgi:hypothetical protein